MSLINIKKQFGCDPAYYGLEKDFAELENELKILDIIKDKKVNLFIINKCNNYCDYLNYKFDFGNYITGYMLNEKEFKLIKEWLDDK